MKKAQMWRQNSSASMSSSKGEKALAKSGSSSSSEPHFSQTPAAAASSSSSGRGSGSGRNSDGDLSKLPAGWKRKESKSQKGKFYYISPQGKTQWVPPQLKHAKSKALLPKTYNWVSEVEICFQEGRLGVSLREVHQMETLVYAQFQAEVDDLPKVNGKAGPAELHNWSVKPHMRLTIGMRVTSIEDVSLAGLTYKEVVAKLKGASRPVRIKFADVTKGTLEDQASRGSDGSGGARGSGGVLGASGGDFGGDGGQSSAYMQQKQEYTRVLVTGELHTEMWTIENKKLLRSLTKMQRKWDTVSSEFDVLNARRMALRKENEGLLSDKDKYELMMKHLKLQASYAMENPELVHANELAKRNAELNEDIVKMSAGNKRLRKERETLQATLDELEKQLAKVEKSKDDEDERGAEDDFLGLETTAPPKEQLAVLKKKKRGFEDELAKEQRKASKVQKEMEQLIKHYASLGTDESTLGSSSSSSSSRPSRSDDKDKEKLSASGRGHDDSSKPKSEFAALEARILELRKKQRSVVETLSKAAQAGDHKLAKDCQRRRQKIKDELKDAQDELHRLKTQGSSSASGSQSAEPTRSRQASTSTSAASGSGRRRGSSSGKKSKPSSSKDSGNGDSRASNTLSSSGAGTRSGKMPMLSGFLDKGPTEWSERGLISNMKTMRGARERWCVITADGFLKYYKRRGDSVVRGEINLADKSFEVVCEDIKRAKEFVVSTDEQQSHFFTKSPMETGNWVKTLRAAHAFLVAANAPPLPPPRSKRVPSAVDLEKQSRSTRQDSKKEKPGFDLDGLDEAAGSDVPEEDEFYGRATLGF